MEGQNIIDIVSCPAVHQSSISNQFIFTNILQIYTHGYSLHADPIYFV